MSKNLDPLLQYYENIYPTLCTPDSRFLSSKDGLQYVSRIVVVLSLPFHILSTYCVLKKTPENMKLVKNSLINLNIWSTLTGVSLGFFICPYFYFPCMAGFSMGFLSDWGFPQKLQFYIVMVFNFAITMLFENRSSLIMRNRFRIKTESSRFQWIFGNFFGSMTIIIPVFLKLPNQMEAKMKVLETLPCPTREFFTEHTLVLATDGFWDIYLKYSFLIIYYLLLAQIMFFSSCCIYYLFIADISQVSPQTRRLQIHSFWGIVVQTFIPITLSLAPVIITVLKRRDAKYDQANNNLVFIFICAQNGVTSLSTLMVQSPYRKFLKSFICWTRKKKGAVVHIASDLTMRL